MREFIDSREAFSEFDEEEYYGSLEMELEDQEDKEDFVDIDILRQFATMRIYDI